MLPSDDHMPPANADAQSLESSGGKWFVLHRPTLTLVEQDGLSSKSAVHMLPHRLREDTDFHHLPTVGVMATSCIKHCALMKHGQLAACCESGELRSIKSPVGATARFMIQDRLGPQWCRVAPHARSSPAWFSQGPFFHRSSPGTSPSDNPVS